jgi:hypothetical protein
MSQRVFQATMARLVVDAVFCGRVRAEHELALDGDLTQLERERLVAIAFDRGLDATRTLYKGFRLSKLYATLPMTCTLLGDDRLAREVGLYWSARVSVSLYYFEEAFGFCDHLQARLRSGLRVAYLDEVLAYERACLELQRPRHDGDVPAAQLVMFRHDPELLLSRLAMGRRPRAIPQLSCTLLGELDADNKMQWHFVVNVVKKKTPTRKRHSYQRRSENQSSLTT